MQITALLRCYPPAWRERYETEMTAVLEDHRAGLWTWFDLLRGAFDARFDPAFAGGRSMLINRLRRSEIAVFCAFIVYVLAGFGFQKMTEDADKAGIMHAHAAVGIGYYAVIGGAVIAALAVAAGSLPIGLSVVRRVIFERRADLIALLGVPVVLGAAVLGWGIAVAQNGGGIQSVGVRAFIIFVMVAAFLSAASVSLAVSRVELSESTVRNARIPALVASVGMALSLIGILVWGLALRSAAPDLYALNGGALRSYAYFTWLRVVVVMGLATVAAIAAVWRGMENSGPSQTV